MNRCGGGRAPPAEQVLTVITCIEHEFVSILLHRKYLAHRGFIGVNIARISHGVHGLQSFVA